MGHKVGDDWRAHTHLHRLRAVIVPISGWHFNHFNLQKPSQGKVPGRLLLSCPCFQVELGNQGEIEKISFCNYHKISILWNFRLQTRKAYLSRVMLYKTQYVSKYKIPFSRTLCCWARLYNIISKTPDFCCPCWQNMGGECFLAFSHSIRWAEDISWKFYLHAIFIPTPGSGEYSSGSPHSMSHKGKKLIWDRDLPNKAQYLKYSNLFRKV